MHHRSYNLSLLLFSFSFVMPRVFLKPDNTLLLVFLTVLKTPLSTSFSDPSENIRGSSVTRGQHPPCRASQRG